MQKFYALFFVLFLITLPTCSASPLLYGNWRLEGESWGGQLTVPDLTIELPGVEKKPTLTWPSWRQELNLGALWSPSPHAAFQLELTDSGNWGVAFASDGSWGRESTFGPFLIKEAFAGFQGNEWQLRAGRFRPALGHTLLSEGPISLEGFELDQQRQNLTFSLGVFRLSSLYWPETDYVVNTDQLLSLGISSETNSLAWSLVALPTEFGKAKALGGQVAFEALGGVVSGEGALYYQGKKIAPALKVAYSQQREESIFSLAAATVDPAFTPILSSLGSQRPEALLAEEALPFATGSTGLAASYSRQLGQKVLELHGALRILEAGVQETLGAALYLPQCGGELSLAFDLLSAENLAARAKVGWQISF